MIIKFIVKLPDGGPKDRPELTAAEKLEGMAALFRQRDFKAEMNKHGLKLDLFDRSNMFSDKQPARIGVLTVERG